LGRLEHQYGEQHGDSASLDQHHHRFWRRRHEPGASGDPGSDEARHTGAERDTKRSINDPAGERQLAVISHTL
jgi:hypothetical protein